MPMPTIYDTILWLKSRSTGRRFPVVLFSADTDMPTEGWVCLSSTRHAEVVVTQLTAAEYEAGGSPAEAYAEVERRVNRALGRDDLKCSWVVRVEEMGPSGAGMSFQDFLKVYRPPKVWYRDIFDPAGEAEEDARVDHTDSSAKAAASQS
jgi:hypothetical protein